MEQLVILVIIGLVSLVNWVLQKAAKRREDLQPKPPAHAQTRHAAETRRQTMNRPAKDPMRELMEALGLPPDEAPPPLPQRAATVVVEQEEFANTETGVPDASSLLAGLQKPVRPDEKTARLAGAFAAAERPSSSPRVQKVRSLLSDRSRQREAIILSEILGQPLALRPSGTHCASFVP